MKVLWRVAAPMELDPHRCVQAGTHLVKTNLHVLLSYYSSCKSMEVELLWLLGSQLYEKHFFTSQEAVGGNDYKCFLNGLPRWALPVQVKVIPAPDGSWWSSFQEDLLHDPARHRGETGWPLSGSSIIKKGVMFLLLQSVGISPDCHNSSNMMESDVATPSRFPQGLWMHLITSHGPVHLQIP